MKLDPAQRHILTLLQKDSTLSTQVLADKVGMSPTPCWRRVRDMEEAGVTRGYVALVDRHKVGLGTCVWVRVKLKQHGGDVLERFWPRSSASSLPSQLRARRAGCFPP